MENLSESMLKMKQAKINECLKLVRISNRKINQIRISSNETEKHIAMKTKLAMDLIKSGHSIITEAIFETGGRADILVLDEFRVIEIMATETEESIAKKRLKYPEGLRLEVIKCV